MQRNNKYGFDENFNGSSISDQSEDIIIVEPLDEQQQAINKTNALYLTGMHAPYSQSSSVIKPSQSRMISQHDQKPNESAYRQNQQQSKPTYNPNAQASRKYDPSLIQKQQQSNQQLPIVESQVQPVPRATQNIILTQTVKPEPQKPQLYQPVPESRVLADKYNYESEEEDQFRQQPPMKQSNRLSTQSDQRKPDPPKTQAPRETIKQEPKAEPKAEPQSDPVLTIKEKQQLIANSKEQLLHIDTLPTKITTSQFVGADVCEIFTVQSGRLKLTPDFNSIMSGDNNSIVFVGIIGQNKSGKSTLMNEIAHVTGKSKFGNTGTWMYTKPLIIETKSFYFVDCTTDNQLICALLMLSCSTLLYNIIQLDDNSIWCFPVLDTLQKLLTNEYALTQLLPSMTWVQRDTMQTRPITELQEFLLKANKGHLFENLIRQRDAISIAPQGTSEFQLSITALKDRIILGSLGKQVNGYNLTGPLFFSYVEYMAELLNQPKQLQLDQVWMAITEDYTKYIYNQSLMTFVKNSENLFKEGVINEITMYKNLRDLKDISLQYIFPQSFLQNKNRQYQVYKKKLVDVLYAKEKQAFQYFSLTSQIENENIIEKNIPKLNLKDSDSFAQSFGVMIDQLLKQRYQLNQCTALSETLQRNYKNLIEDLFQKYATSSGGGEDQLALLQQIKQQVASKDEELDKKKKQVQLQEKRKNQAIKEIQDLQDQIKLERESGGGGARESMQQNSEEIIYKLKSEKASNMKEINLLKKAYLEEKRKKEQESGCQIY